MEILLIFLDFILAIIIVVIVVMWEIKLKKPRNKVHFYITRDKNGTLNLWLGKPFRDKYYWFSAAYHIVVIAVDKDLNVYGLNTEDYNNLKWEDEPIEVFLNLNN